MVRRYQEGSRASPHGRVSHVQCCRSYCAAKVGLTGCLQAVGTEYGLLAEWHEVSLRAVVGLTADAVLAGV